MNLGVFYAGGTRGSYQQVMNKMVSVSKGSLSYDQTYDDHSIIYGFKPQSRTLRTEDANQQVSNDSAGSCDVETRDEDNIDRNFQLLIVMHGPGTIKWIRPFALLVPEDLSGDARACDDETGVRSVRFDGVGIKVDDYADAGAGLTAAPIAHFTSTKTQLLDQDGFQAAGVGTAESIVSQSAADRVATVIATRMAEFELGCMQPPITSIGKV